MVAKQLKDALEDNVLTMLCWDFEWAPKIAKQVTANMFSTHAYQRIAQVALDHVIKYGVPARAHLRDYLEKEIRHRDGQFLRGIIDRSELLHPELQGQVVQDDLDRFITGRKMVLAVEEFYDALNNDDIKGARLKLWEGINAAPATMTTLLDPWADPVPPPFDVAILPREMRDFSGFVRERSLTMGSDAAGLFWSGLSCMSAALDGSIRMQMKENDTGFQVPPALPALLIGDPSTGRTATLDVTWGPLKRLQSEENERNAVAVRLWENEDEKERGPKPRALRYIAYNVTIEALQDILAHQDRGVALLKDEWAEYISSMTRYAGDRGMGDRAFYLQTFNGGPYGVDRGRSGRNQGYSADINNCLTTICGGIQRDRLRDLNAKENLTSDGLLQRAIPVLVQPRLIGRDEPGGREQAAYDGLIEALAGMRPGNLRLSLDAQRIRQRVECDLMGWETNTTLSTGFRTFAGKLHGIWGRLVLVLSRIIEPDRTTVSAEVAELAEHLIMQHVIQHAALLYQMLGGGSGDDETTRAIAGFLLSQRRARVTSSDLSSKVWRLKGMDARRMLEAVSPLEVGGWLEPEGGLQPKRNAWRVNEDVYQQFGERAEREKYERTQARSLIQAAVAGDQFPDVPDGNGGGGLCEGDQRAGDQPSRVRARARNLEHLEIVAKTTSDARAQSGTSGNVEYAGDVEAEETTPLADSSDSGTASLVDDSAAQVPPLAGEPQAHVPTALADDSAAQQHLTSENVVPLSRAHAQSGTSGNDIPAFLRNSDGPRIWDGDAWVRMSVKARADALRRRFKDRAGGGG